LEPPHIRQLYKEQGVRKVSASDPRGVVLPLTWRRRAADGFFRPAENFTLLRKSLLYWDEIVWPMVDIMSPLDQENGLLRLQGRALPLDLQFLVSEKRLENELVNVVLNLRDPTPVSINAEFIARTKDKIFLNRDHYERGIWALADTTDEFESPDPDVPITRAALFRLADVLPAPRDDVPFQDILEFKNRYKDELLNLRARLDSLYSQIIDSRDAPYQESVALRELDKAIADLNKAATFSPTKFIRSTLTTVLDLGEHFVAGSEITRTMQLPETEQLIVGGAYSALRLVFKKQASPRGIAGPYAYLYDAKNWGLLKPP
jgi:hypothetical protein